jgi:hypothetical protein
MQRHLFVAVAVVVAVIVAVIAGVHFSYLY